MRIHKVLPLLLALAALPAEATTTYYCPASCGGNTEAAFTAALGALLTAGFNSTGTVNFTGATSGTTVSNVGGTGTSFAGFSNALPATLNVVGSQLQHTMSGAGTTIAITLPSTVFALGVHVTQSAATEKPYCFESTPGNCDASFVLSSGTPAFVGVISDVILPNQQFRSPGSSNFLYINDFSMAEAPEASTFVLVGTGLILFPLWKRRARRRVLLAEPSLQC